MRARPRAVRLHCYFPTLVLDELDRELERRGHRFVRYADDCNIYVAQRTSGTASDGEYYALHHAPAEAQGESGEDRRGSTGGKKFLGFSFTSEREPRRRIATKAIARFKERIREQTRRTRGISLRQMVKELATYLRGWLGYFGDCQTLSVLQNLETWLRRRLDRWCGSNGSADGQVRELRKRGVSEDLAAKTAGSPHGPWRLANSPALTIALPNAYFA